MKKRTINEGDIAKAVENICLTNEPTVKLLKDMPALLLFIVGFSALLEDEIFGEGE